MKTDLCTEQKLPESYFLSQLMTCSWQWGKELEAGKALYNNLGYMLILKIDNAFKYIHLEFVRKGEQKEDWDVHKVVVNNILYTVVLLEYELEGNRVTEMDYYLLPDDSTRDEILKNKPICIPDTAQYCSMGKRHLFKVHNLADFYRLIFSAQNGPEFEVNVSAKVIFHPIDDEHDFRERLL